MPRAGMKLEGDGAGRRSERGVLAFEDRDPCGQSIGVAGHALEGVPRGAREDLRVVPKRVFKEVSARRGEGDAEVPGAQPGVPQRVEPTLITERAVEHRRVGGIGQERAGLGGGTIEERAVGVLASALRGAGQRSHDEVARGDRPRRGLIGGDGAEPPLGVFVVPCIEGRGGELVIPVVAEFFGRGVGKRRGGAPRHVAAIGEDGVLGFDPGGEIGAAGAPAGFTIAQRRGGGAERVGEAVRGPAA